MYFWKSKRVNGATEESGEVGDVISDSKVKKILKQIKTKKCNEKYQQRKKVQILMKIIYSFNRLMRQNILLKLN